MIIIGWLTFESPSDEEIQAKKEKVVQDSLERITQKKINDSLILIAEANKVKAIEMLKSFKKNEDEFNNTNFYRDKRTPNYTNTNFIYPYIGEKNGRYWLRLKFQYSADSWLFIHKATLLVDGEKFYITGRWEKDNNTEIWEWLDIQARDAELAILQKIANSKQAKVRYEGRQYHDDRTLTNKEKDIIKKTLEIFTALNS